MFNVKQVRALKAKLKDRHVRSRIENGTTLHYLEGWHVIAEANRIFGFDGWDRETVETTCVYTKRNGERYEAVYVAKVRIRVLADGHVVIREGTGSGEADTPSPGQAHEFALKAAETDATKRALITFGNAFGLSLYAGNGATRRDPPRAEPPAPQAENEEREKDTSATASPAEFENPETNPNGRAVPNQTARQQRIDKSALTLAEPTRLRDPDHLKFVFRHGCVVCGRNRTHAHHLTFAQPNALGRKVSDEYTVPLCSTHHRDLHHAGNEQVWWAEKGVDPMGIAKALWEESEKTRRGRSEDNEKGQSGADV